MTTFKGHLLTGDHASRPAANTVPDGTLYSCTDHGIVYQADEPGNAWNDWATITGAVPGAHAASHQNGGSDEISVAGLSGLLADDQNPVLHAADHENGGADEISVAGLSGLLADGQTPLAHKTSHENGGADEISVAGLSGLLADGQTPLAHKTSHENGGADEISVAGLSGLLADEQNAGKIKGVDVDDTNIADGRVPVFRTASGNIEFEDQSGSGGGTAIEVVVLQDQKAQNTAGGTFTSGAWQTRTLNTEVVDTGGRCTLASNEFTLTAGTYRYRIFAPAWKVNRHQARLFNVTDAVVVQYGTSLYASAVGDTQNFSVIEGEFTIATSKAFRVEHRCATTVASQGFGVESNLATEVYTTVVLEAEGTVTTQSGASVQVKNTQTGAVATSAVVMPLDDTIPQNTEGAEFTGLATTITPTNASNKLMIEVIVLIAASAATIWPVLGLFQDSVAGALAAVFHNEPTTNGARVMVLRHYMTAGTASATTFKVRAGPHIAGTITLNGNNAARLMGGVAASSMTITEYVP